jgi:integrase
MMLYTGQRRSNVTDMKFQDIDTISGTWTLIPSETKNKRYHIVPLFEEALSIIKQRYELLKGQTAYVFPSPRNIKVPVAEPKGAWSEFLEEAKIPDDLTMHDIRRSSGSLMLLSTKGNMKAVQKFLGHRDMATTSKVYTHLDLEAISTAVNDTFRKLT